jgi:hypothetical protein
MERIGRQRHAELMLRKVLKVFASIAGGLVGLAVVVCVAAVVTNWRDEPPSPDALRLAAQYESRPAVTDEDNAFIYLLGFDAPLDQDPRAVGGQRFAWLQTLDGTPLDRAADPQTARLEYASTDPAVEQFLTVCGTDNAECSAAFAGGGGVFDRWSATHPWLLARYRELVAHDGWREHIPGLTGPRANFAPALRGQELLLLQAKRLADDGDGATVNTLLANDVRFWRMVLASSDSVLTTMIATAAMRRHFAWASLAVRDLRTGRGAAAVPIEWRTPMSADEISLRRELIGEWIYLSGALPDMLGADVASDESLATLTSDRLTRTLFQPQDTLNRQSAYLAAVIDTLDAPLLGFASVADGASDLAYRTAEKALPPRSLYNVVGAVMLAGPANYAGYARRLADVEGMRRAALAVVTLRDEQPLDMAAALAASPLRNPYDDQPLRWDARDQAVVFVGLEPGERGEHRFYY